MTSSPKVFIRDATGLVREMGFLDMTFLSMAATSFFVAFVFIMLYTPYFFPGCNLPVVLFVGDLCALVVAAVYSMLGRAMPRTGGDYVWSTRILGPAYGIVQWTMLFIMQIIIIVEVPIIFPISTLLPQFLLSLGVTTNNSALISAALTVTQPTVAVIVNLFFVLLALGLALTKLSTFVRIQRYVYFLYLTVFAITVIALLTLNPSTTSSIFDHAMQIAGSNATYSGVIQQAQSGGFSSGFSLGNTLWAILPWGFFMYLGFNWSTYLSGEVKNAAKNITRGMFACVLFTGFVFVTVTMIAYNALGADFLNSASYVGVTNPSYFPTIPTITLLASLMSPYMALAIGVAVFLSAIVVTAGMTLNLSRMIFALSFDRVLPMRLADVNVRFHSPHWAVLLVGVGYVILVPLFWLTSYASAFLNLSLITPIASAMPFVAAIAFYFKKRELFTRTVGGKSDAVKLILLSVVAVAMFVIYAAGEIVPINTGLYLGTSLSIAFEAVIVVLVIGIVLYAAAKYRLRRIGIDIGTMAGEIPPE